MIPKSLETMIEFFRFFPGVGEKTALRFALALLSLDSDELEEIMNNIVSARHELRYCSECGVLSDTNICLVCNDVTRDSNSLIVVESSKDVFSLEKIGNFNGYYYVLNGLISPLDGVTADEVGIPKLMERINKLNCKEIILVISSGIEADATALYIKRLLDMDEKYKDVVVTRIATGIPANADMDYVDALTLDFALKNRKEVL